MNPEPNADGRGHVRLVLGAAPEGPSPAVHRSTGDPQAPQDTTACSRCVVVTTSMRPSHSMCARSCCCCTCRRLLRPPLDDALWMVAGPSWLTYGAFLSSAQDVSTLALLTLSTGEHYASCGAQRGKRRQRTLCAAG